MKKYPPVIRSVPHIIHGGDYNPEQWIKQGEAIWREDMRLAKLAGLNSLSVGIFSWAMLEPNEGEYHFEWLDTIMDLLNEHDLTAVLATPSGARPAWMSQKYPEVLRVRKDRGRNLHGERHNHCLTSPVYREKVTAINTRLAERYKDHPALGLWHISNEYGGKCHCPLCQEKFREWLQARYESLDALNDAWWTTFWSHRYSDWSQLESPSPIGERNTHGLSLDWKRFTTDQYIDFYRHETAPLKRITPDVPCTTNLMAGFDGIDYGLLARELDVVSWDAYPQWTGGNDTAIGHEFGFQHDMMYGLLRKPFFLMESSPSATNWQPVCKLRRPGVHKLQSLQAVAHGSDSVQYFQFRKGRGASEKFHGAVVDHEGTENTRVFKDVAEVGKLLSGIDCVVGAPKPAKVAVIHDYVNRWALQDIVGALQGKTGYIETVMAHYAPFWDMGIPVDVIDETRSLESYDLVVAPMLYLLREGVEKRIAGYVKAGGTFVATYMSGWVNETDLCYTGGFPGPLKEVLGIWAEELDALYPGDENSVVWNGRAYKAFDLCELTHAKGAQVLGTYGSDFYAGMPAVTCNKFGKGRAYYVAARTGPDFLRDFYEAVSKEAGVKPLLEQPLPPGVTAQARAGEHNTYVFLMNFTAEPRLVEAPGLVFFIS